LQNILRRRPIRINAVTDSEQAQGDDFVQQSLKFEPLIAVLRAIERVGFFSGFSFVFEDVCHLITQS
jgi:hypothetical protein